MTLIAQYALDQQRRDATALLDVSGHSNNHDIPLAYPGSSIGFGHKRAFTDGWFYAQPAANEADLLTFDHCTIMAWVRPWGTSGGSAGQGQVLGFGLATSSAAAANHCWALVTDNSTGEDNWFMFWEHTGGVDVVARSPAGSLKKTEKEMVHICCIRTVNEALRDVKFVKNGVDLSADVEDLTAPDGTTAGTSHVEAFRACGGAWNALSASCAHIRFYDTALTVPQVNAIYTAERPGIIRPSHYDTGTELKAERPVCGWVGEST
jgi:hypothetical protein